MDDERSPGGFAADEWLPVQEQLLLGLNHALSNRLGSISAIAMLLEGSGDVDPRLRDTLAQDAQRLEALLAGYRALANPGDGKRDGCRIQDALGRAVTLIEHHHACRDVRVEGIDAVHGVTALRIGASEALRACVMALLPAMVVTAPSHEVWVTAADDAALVRTLVRRHGADADALRARAECQALARYAAGVGGDFRVTTDGAAAVLALALPALTSRAPGSR